MTLATAESRRPRVETSANADSEPAKFKIVTRTSHSTNHRPEQQNAAQHINNEPPNPSGRALGAFLTCIPAR
jgi:hypothetical protein